MFHPSLFFLATLFGGGPWTRILHPFGGVLVFVSFGGMYLRLARHNTWDADDRAWLDQAGAMLAGRAHQMPPVGRYNAGQKILFWWMTVSLLVLLVTGLLFLASVLLPGTSRSGWCGWRPWRIRSPPWLW